MLRLTEETYFNQPTKISEHMETETLQEGMIIQQLFDHPYFR